MNDMNSESPKPLRVLILAAFFEPGFRGGGPIRSVARAIETLPPHAIADLVTNDRDLGDQHPYPNVRRFQARGRHRVHYINLRRPLHVLIYLRVLCLGRYDVLYVNSFFDPLYSMLPVLLTRLRLLSCGHLVIAPRGELAPAALEIRRTRKRLVLAFWRVLSRMGPVTTWQATADHEVADICTHFTANARVVQVADLRGPEPICEATLLPNNSARFVYVGRVARIKNLHLVLAAASASDSDFELDIYGPIEDSDYWKYCSDLMKGDPRISYKGEIAPHEVQSVFSAYDGYVFPTQGENFGHTIAESLSAGCPVICSDRTQWGPVLRQGAGIVLDELTVPAVRAAMERVVHMASEDRLRFRRQAVEVFGAWREQRQAQNVIELVTSNSAV